MPKAFDHLSKSTRCRILRRLRPRPDAAEAHNLDHNPDIPVENLQRDNFEAEDRDGNLDNRLIREEPLENQIHQGNLEAGENEENLLPRNVSPQPQDSETDGDSSASDEDGPHAGDNEERHNEALHNNDADEPDSEDSDDEDLPFDFNLFNGRGGNLPVYAGAPVTVKQSLCLILSVALKHNLNNACISDVMSVINFHCPNQQLKKISWNRYKRFFSFDQSPAKKHYFCPNCYQLLASANAQCNTCFKKPSYFLQVPLMPQLSQLFQQDNFRLALHHRFQRQKQNINFIEDIYDGSLYQQHVNTGFLSEPNNISFLWNTDGAPVYKSKNFCIWPFYLSINELPYKERFQRKNVLLAGLWFGRTKPNANLFMKSFRRDFRKLYEGVQIALPRNPIPILVRGILLAGTCDLPAKCTVMNFSQFNTDSGCPHCEFEGTRFPLPSGKELQVYNYVRNFVKRNSVSSIRYADEALRTGVRVNGVKGPTMLSQLMPDFISGMAIDSMHNVGGIIRKLLKLWFDSKYRGSVFSMRNILPVIDAILVSLKPPNFIHRMPRSLEDLCHWKTSELIVFLFYYGPILLRDTMRPQTYNHFMKLVAGLSYLSCTSISNDMIDMADTLLHKFVEEYEIIYGLRHMTINIHLLLHVSDQVRVLGPLWISSCFPFENLNAILLKSIHGNTNLDSQLIRNHWQVFCSSKLLDTLEAGPVRDFCLGSRRKFKVLQQIDNSCYAVGHYSDLYPHEGIIHAALQQSRVHYRNIQKYCRFFKGRMMYVSESYPRGVQTKSSFCMYILNNTKQAGNIICFVKVCQRCAAVARCDCVGEHFAILKNVVLSEPLRVEYADNGLQSDLKYLFKVNLRDDVNAIPVACLTMVCFYMCIQDQSFLAEAVHITDLC